MLFQYILLIFATDRYIKQSVMEANTLQKREDFLRKFEDAKQRKHEMVEKMKEEMTIECEKRTGKKPTSFFVL